MIYKFFFFDRIGSYMKGQNSIYMPTGITKRLFSGDNKNALCSCQAIEQATSPSSQNKFSLIQDCRSKGQCGFQKTKPFIKIDPFQNVGSAKKVTCDAAKYFSSWGQVDKYITDNSKTVQPKPIIIPPQPAQPIPIPVTISSAPPQAQYSFRSEQATPTFSKTNNQVPEVDQADILKSDGKYIYTISEPYLLIVLAYPAEEAKVVSTIHLSGFYPQALFISGNYLAVIGKGTKDFTKEKKETKYNFDAFKQSSSDFTQIRIYDVSNKEKLILVKLYKVSGSYWKGQMLENGFIYLTTMQFLNGFCSPPYLWYDLGTGIQTIEPSSIFYYPIKQYDSLTALEIFTLNLSNPNSNQFSIKALFARPSQDPDQENNIYTSIIRIYVSQTLIEPVAIGKVQGTFMYKFTMNQFSLDQHNDYLRVATTLFQNGLNSSNLYVLDQCLRVQGFISNIAPGFAQSRCYLVTFRLVDPFFVINLEDPAKPTIQGQLKITGFSTYLHLYNNVTILGIGREVNDIENRTAALKLGLSLYQNTICNPHQNML